MFFFYLSPFWGQVWILYEPFVYKVGCKETTPKWYPLITFFPSEEGGEGIFEKMNNGTRNDEICSFLPVFMISINGISDLDREWYLHYIEHQRKAEGKLLLNLISLLPKISFSLFLYPKSLRTCRNFLFLLPKLFTDLQSRSQ